MALTTWIPYRDLPHLHGTDYRLGWECFTADDDLGCLGHISPEARRNALASVELGEVVNISLPLDEPAPVLFGRGPYKHEVFDPDITTIFSPERNIFEDRLHNLYSQGSTQWDGFRHVRAGDAGFFTGVTAHPRDTDRLSVSAFAEQGIIGRGVFADLMSIGTPSGDNRYSVDDLRQAVSAVGTALQPGDVLCLRTGWMAEYAATTGVDRETFMKRPGWIGISGNSDVAEFLWDARIAAVVADNPSVEAAPVSPVDGSLHRRLLPLLGVPLGELFTFETLASRLSALGRSTFAFVSVPLNLPGGAGSTGNAVAIL